MKRATVFLGGVLALLLTAAATAEPPGRMSDNDAIDIAGMQRMLTQRILKAYCEIGLGESRGTARDQLQKAVQRFDANLGQLEGHVQDPAARTALAAVREVWPSYRDLALAAPSKTGATRLLALNHQLLPLTHRVVVELEQRTGTGSGQRVNMAGRQRMLSQRMAMFYLLRLWGVTGEQEATLLAQAEKEYAAALVELSRAPGNDTSARELLRRLQSSANLLHRAMAAENRNLAFLIGTTSDRMLEDADRLTSFYVNQEHGAPTPVSRTE